MPSSTRFGHRARRATAKSSTPRSYGFVEADFDRKIFLDQRAPVSNTAACARDRRESASAPTCQTLGVEFMHHHQRRAEGVDFRNAIEGPDKEISFTPRRSPRDPQQADRSRGFLRNSATPNFTGTKRFGLDGRRIADPGAGSRSSSAAAISA